MKNLDESLQELTLTEMQETNGGIGPLAIACGIGGFCSGIVIGIAAVYVAYRVLC